MGFSYRKRIRIGRGLSLNLSNRGVSGSARTRRGSISSRGNGSLRLFKGLSYRKKLW